MTPLSRYVVETLVTLAGVVVLSVLVLSAVKRVGLGKASGPLALLQRLPLEGRRAVYLVRAGETVYVLAASENALAKLGEMPSTHLSEQSPEELRSFKDVLKRAVGVTSEATKPHRADPPPQEPHG